MSISTTDFLSQQSLFERVHRAIDAKQAGIEKILEVRDLKIGNFYLLIVAFKERGELLLYAKAKEATQYQVIQTYAICGRSGVPGPKRKEADGQVPEGFYHIDRFNPKSKFHLSLGLNYPNESDRKKGDPANPGGDIFIHGSCQTTGCIPLTDAKMEEIYLYAIHARNNGQEKISVYIFPFRMTDMEMDKYRLKVQSNPEIISFWDNLKMGYDTFSNGKKALDFSFAGNGDYLFSGKPRK